MANYAQIRSMDISNGEGIGISIFFSGCDFHCKNCFNKELWNYSYGYEFNDATIETIISLANKPYITRLSILGGDPLMEQNLDCVLQLVNRFRLSFPNKSIWIYSGYTWNQVMYPVITDDFNPSRDELLRKRKEIVKQCTVMVDGRYIDSQRNPSKKWAGSDNQRVIDIRKSLEQNKVVLSCD